MRGLAHLLISLPLLAVPAAAEELGLPETMTRLAQASAADEKCKVLAPGDHDILADLTARAEIALVQREAVASAQAARDQGKRSGEAASCDGATVRMVSETFAAARGASPQAKPERAAALAQPAPKKPTPAVKPPASLLRYGVTVEAYYAERRCKFLSRTEIKDFYSAIVHSHQSLLGQYGGRAVSSAKRAAEQRALSLACDGGTERKISSAYAALR